MINLAANIAVMLISAACMVLVAFTGMCLALAGKVLGARRK